jgi:hypothetical protein
MCQSERLLTELGLSFHREVLSKTVEIEGRDAAAQGCAQDILKAIKEDSAGCYEASRAKAGLPKPDIQDVRIRPAAASVTISFRSNAGAASQQPWEVAILSEVFEPEAEYLVSSATGEFVLNTAAERPVAPKSGAAHAPGKPLPIFWHAPGTTYCFGIRSPAGEERRGTFTTTGGGR